jgi:small subunit ribosomal protein S11e
LRQAEGRTDIGTGGKKVATKTKRWYKEVGLGFKTPAEAINGTYIG